MNSIEQRPTTPWRTSSGLMVGSKYVAPERVQEVGRDAERLQRALICERRNRWPDVLIAACGVAALIAVVAT
jgi:hypothetical protein